jgi:DNA modification methylase
LLKICYFHQNEIIYWKDFSMHRYLEITILTYIPKLQPKYYFHLVIGWLNFFLRNLIKRCLIDENSLPPIFSTTLWDYPKQSYDYTPKGNNKYPGALPLFIIYNLIHRYTEPREIVCDPMAGSGTTINVCGEEKLCVIASCT